MFSPTSSKVRRGAAVLVFFLTSILIRHALFFPNKSKDAETVGRLNQLKTTGSEPTQGPIHDVTVSLNEGTNSGPRIRQATMIFDAGAFDSVYERAVDSHLKHGELWNIPTHVLRRDIVDRGYFNKPAFLLGLIITELTKPYDKRAEWIVWFDADSIFLNPAVPWTLFLPPPEFDDIHVLATKDQNGFNAGMFFIRVHEWSVKMLSEVIALRQILPTLELGFADQSAIDWVCSRPGYEEHFIYQPHDWWNSYGFDGGIIPTKHFVLHFAGVGTQEGTEPKATTMARWLDKLQSHGSEFNIPLENLTLGAEVSEYWRILIEAQRMLEKSDEWLVEEEAAQQDFWASQRELRQAIMKDADNSTNIISSSEQLQNLMTSEGMGDATGDGASNDQDLAT